jgi:hypothetical protein
VLKESSGLMSVHDARVLIGYSVFDTSQECYSYNENACFIASTRQAAEEFLNVACMDSRDGRVDVVDWDNLRVAGWHCRTCILRVPLALPVPMRVQSRAPGGGPWINGKSGSCCLGGPFK